METKSLLFLLLAGGLCSTHLVASMITYRKTRSWHDMRMNVFKTVFFLKLAVVLFYGVSNRENIYLAWSTDVLLGLACLYFLFVAVSGLLKTRSWYIVRKDVNAALYGISLFLMAGPLAAMPEDEIVRHIVPVVAFVSFFGLVGLWDLLWVTFTKRDVTAGMSLGSGLAFALYVCMLIFICKEIIPVM